MKKSLMSKVQCLKSFLVRRPAPAGSAALGTTKPVVLTGHGLGSAVGGGADCSPGMGSSGRRSAPSLPFVGTGDGVGGAMGGVADCSPGMGSSGRRNAPSLPFFQGGGAPPPYRRDASGD